MLKDDSCSRSILAVEDELRSVGKEMKKDVEKEGQARLISKIRDFSGDRRFTWIKWIESFLLDIH